MMAIGGIAILFLKEDLIAYIDVFEGLGLSFEPMLLLIIGFMMSTVFTSSISLSLEGKNFWILKTLPIKAETVMFGKMIFNVLLTLPVAFFALFMAGIALEINFLNLVVMLLYIATLAFLGSILGSIINLHFPKFNYINETEVVKQSLGALLGMFATWLVLTVNGLLYYYLNSYFDFALLMIFNILINTLAFCGAFYYIKSRAQVIFNKL
jgi:ABC-2 type transport system permease protein